jgi:hypothetical protein
MIRLFMIASESTFRPLFIVLEPFSLAQ